jgi:hypothetical protein
MRVGDHPPRPRYPRRPRLDSLGNWEHWAALHVIFGHDGLALGTPWCPATLSKIGWEPQVEAWGEFSLGGMKGNFCSILRVV